MIAAGAAALALTFAGNWSGHFAVYEAVGGRVALVAADPLHDLGDRLPYEEGNVVPSPDGRHVAYSEGSSEYVVRTDGTGRALLASGISGAPVWSPDSRRIAWFAYPELHVASADGTDERVVDAHMPDGPWRIGWSHDTPRFVSATFVPPSTVSPDGRWVVGDVNGAIEVPNTRTNRTRVLAHEVGTGLLWSPDSTTVAYLDSAGNLRTVTLAGRVRIVARNMGVIRRLAWTYAVPGLHYRAVPRETGVYTELPPQALAADAGRVAATGCGRILVWTPATGASVDAADVPNCDGVDLVTSLALAGDRVAWSMEHFGNAHWWSASMAVLGGAPQTLVSGQDLCCAPAAAVAGAGSLLVYAERAYNYRTSTWSVHEPGGPPLINFMQNAQVPVTLDVDGDRVLVRHDSAVDVVLSENGGTVFHLGTPGQPPDAQLDGPNVDIRDGANLDVYATDGGALLHTWPLPFGARLLDAAHGLVALTAEGEVYVVRVSDGLRAQVAPGTLAAFFDGGLAVANGARVHVVPYGQLPSFGVRSSAPPGLHSGDQ